MVPGKDGGIVFKGRTCPVTGRVKLWIVAGLSEAEIDTILMDVARHVIVLSHTPINWNLTLITPTDARARIGH